MESDGPVFYCTDGAHVDFVFPLLFLLFIKLGQDSLVSVPS